MRNYAYSSVDSALAPTEHDIADISLKFPGDVEASSDEDSSFDEDLQLDPMYDPSPGAVGPQRLTQHKFDFLCKKKSASPPAKRGRRGRK